MRDKKKEHQNEKGHRRLDRYGIVTLLLLLFFAVVIQVLSIYIHNRLEKVKEDAPKYQYHFVYISKSEDSYTSSHICEEAENYGRQHKVYVEKLKLSDNAGYSDTDYVEMARSMKVDGIILEGSDDPSLAESISAADEAGIPTVTLLSDCPGSRKSFIEIGDYNLGREYARTIINITRTRTPRVLLLMDQDAEGADSLIDGIRQTLANEGNHLNVELQIENVGELPNFRLSDLTREALSDTENRPDILIAAGEYYTKIVYQAIRDYNLTGKAEIIGYGITEPLLRAVRDDEISALIDADTDQLGMLCVDTLVNYHANGSCSDHIMAEDTVVTKETVERYLDEK